ncbi:MAG: aldehyde dehydrogenase family protein [Verrucomicrobiales bacterium]|nr:aldehyde dehydrogenase family protein [Verrucomicrobiales bacterium]
MKPILLLIDLQWDFLQNDGLLPERTRLIAAAETLLKRARKVCLPVVHVRTTVRREDDRRLPHWRKSDRWLCVEGSPGHAAPHPLQPVEGEAVIDKTGFNGFANGELDRALRESGGDTVVLAGVHLHACVRAIATECLERGYEVRMAEDAVGSYDPVHAAAVRRWLAARCVSFEPGLQALTRDPASRPRVLVHRSPRHSRETLFEMPIAGSKKVAGAVAAAKNEGHHWRETSMNARWEVLEKLASGLEAAAPDLARQMAEQLGKPIGHAREEVRRTAGNIRDVIRRAVTVPLDRDEAAGRVRSRPLGTVAIISPWNNPLAIALGKIAPALIYGNTVVWKPAPAAWPISQAALELLSRTGVPRDAVRLLPGDSSTAQSLAGHPDIDAVTVTGALTAGYAIQEICARSVRPIQAELNGNNAAIVWTDADLKQAARQIAWGAFGFAGQRCTANRRVVVATECLEKFLEELVAAGESIAWGDPLDEKTEIGPMIHAGRRDEHEFRVENAEADGGAHRVLRLQADRARELAATGGAYAQPVIACCDLPDHPLVQEETMSPLLVVQAARDFDHALELCNGVAQGLAAALFSGSEDLKQVFLREARAGILKFNSSTTGVDSSMPFGGWKLSGIGPPEHGDGDRLFYTRLQAVYGL